MRGDRCAPAGPPAENTCGADECRTGARATSPGLRRMINPWWEPEPVAPLTARTSRFEPHDDLVPIEVAYSPEMAAKVRAFYARVFGRDRSGRLGDDSGA